MTRIMRKIILKLHIFTYDQFPDPLYNPFSREQNLKKEHWVKFLIKSLKNTIIWELRTTCNPSDYKDCTMLSQLTILCIHIPEVSNMMRRCWTTRRSVIYSVRVKVPSSRQTIICSILGYQLSCQILRCFLILKVRICILYQHGFYAGSIMFTIIILV